MAGKTDPETGLQEKQQRFADEYLIDFNATEAYRRAGYSAKGAAAHAAASRLLANTAVQAYLTARKAELASRVELSQEEVLRRLMFMALGDIRTLFDENGNLKAMSDLTAEQASLLQGVEVFEEYEGRGKDRVYVGQTKKIKFVNRLDAVVKLGGTMGLFAKKVEHSGPGGGPIQHENKVLSDLMDMVEGSDTGIGRSASRA